MRQVRNRGLVTSALAVLTTAALLLMGAVPAHALVTPVSGTSLVGSKVTINDDHFHPGDTITVSGTGFEVDPMTSGNPGSPVLAIKLNGSQYEAGGFPWEAGGASYIDPEDLPTAGGSEGYAPFVIAGDGTFSGSITIPEDWDEFGPHFLTLLGGSLSTQNPGKTLRVQTFEVHFTVLAEDQAWAEITSIAHAQDSPNNSNIGVKLRNFVRQDGLGGQKVAFRINASGDVLACVETDAAGDANAIVPLPTKATRLLAAGENTLNVLAGNACGEGAQPPGRSIPVTFKLASSTLTSTVHFPGSEIGVALRGFLENGVFGGQKVALVITQPGGDYRSQIACVDTDDAGNVDAAANLPADIPLGSYRLNALAGTACGAGSQPPARSLPVDFEVIETPFAAVTNTALTGKAKVGVKLTASAPTWNRTPDAEPTYQWFRGATAISGATANTYTPVAADAGKKLRIVVTATAEGQQATSSADTSTVALGTFKATKAPKITGTAKVGKKLTASGAKFDLKGVTLKYQWLRGGKVIKGATKATYKLVKADGGKKVSVRVVASKKGYQAVTAKSAAKKVKKK